MSNRYTEEVASRLYSYFVERLDLVENSNGWLVGDCPSCGKVRKFGINVSIGMTNCFVCGPGPGPVALVKNLEGFKTFAEVYKLLQSYEAFNIDLGKRSETPKKAKTKIIKALPKEYKMVGLYDSVIDRVVRKQLKARGFSLTKAMMLGFGYCTTGEFKNRLIIPFYRGGEIIYFNARQITKNGVKYKNPKEEDIEIGKGQVIYNYDALYFYRKVWIFEGVFNAATIGNQATATGGKILTPWQLNEYIKSPCKRIVIALDDDAYKEALKLALQLAPHKKVKVLKFPKGKDANDIGKKATKELEKNTPYLTYKEIYNKYITADRA